jgi:hypothetical protein
MNLFSSAPLAVYTESMPEWLMVLSGGAYDCIDPNEFDAVALYGTYSHIQRLVSSILVASPTDNLFFSDAFLYAGARCWLEQQRTIEIVREMRRHSSIPILVVFEPLFSLPYKTELPEGAKLSSKGRAAVHRALTDVVVEAGGVSIFQPEDTLVDNTFTDPEFSLGSKRLGGKGVAHESTDFAHMNGSYGARVLKLILEKLNKTLI